jgi:hypothetical protein
MAHIKLKSLLSTTAKRVVKESYQKAVGGLKLEHFINSPALSIDERYVFESYLEYRSFKRLNEAVLLNEQTAILLERDLLSEGFFSWLSNKASQAYTWVKAKVENGWAAIKNMWENFKSFVKQVCESIKKMFIWLWDYIKELGAKAYNTVKSAFNASSDKIKEIINSDKDSFTKEIVWCDSAAVHIKNKFKTNFASEKAPWYTTAMKGEGPDASSMDAGLSESTNITLETIFNSDISHVLRNANFINESDDGIVHPEAILKKYPKLEALVHWVIKIVSWVFSLKQKVIQFIVKRMSQNMLASFGILVEDILGGPAAPKFEVLSTIISEIYEVADGLSHVLGESTKSSKLSNLIKESPDGLVLASNVAKQIASKAIVAVAKWLMPWIAIIEEIMHIVHIVCIGYSALTIFATLGSELAKLSSPAAPK